MSHILIIHIFIYLHVTKPTHTIDKFDCNEYIWLCYGAMVLGDKESHNLKLVIED